KPNLPVLGPKLGKELGTVRTALEAGGVGELRGGRFRAAGYELEPEEGLVERGGQGGWAVAGLGGGAVRLDLPLVHELPRRGRVYDLTHAVNTKRKELGLELTDRIRLTIPGEDGDLLEHREWIMRETLAVDLDADGAEIGIERA